MIAIDGREVAAGWEVRRGESWSPLPAGAVLRATLESDLLGEARRLGAGIAREDTTRRAAYAEWLVRSGLLDEASALGLDPGGLEAQSHDTAAGTPLGAH